LTSSDRKSTPKALDEATSRRLARQPRKDTIAELRIRRLLHASRLRYRVNVRELPGTPDIAFGPSKVVVFVDGCFWHACPIHSTVPRNNRDWWVSKLQTNASRDRRVDSELQAAGWAVLRVWEHEPPAEAAARIAAVVLARRS